MLRLEEVTVRRGGREVLRGASLEVQPGRVLAVLGPNGAGKSTCLHAAAGDLAPSGGRILLDGEDLSTMPPPERALRRAVLPQSAQLDFDLSVEEVVLLGRTTRRGGLARAEDVAIARAYLRRVDLPGFGPRSYLSLSGGERQRVHLARVLAQVHERAHPVLLLDEPTSSLDVAHAHHVLRIARDAAAEGAAVLVVLHDLWLASGYADEVALLHRGQLTAWGSAEEVLRPEVVGPVYGVEMIRVPVDGARPLLVPKAPAGAVQIG